MAIEVKDGLSMANQALGRGRKVNVPKLPVIMEKVSKDTQVHIWNVGPWTLTRELGSIGSFRIPACPEGKEYGTPLIIPGIHTEPVPGEHPDFMELRTEPGGGRYIAEQIIGIGPFMTKRDSLEHMGVFIGSEVGSNAKPTKAELATANARLMTYLEELVNEARGAFERGETKEIVDRHRQAARILQLENEQWYSQRTAKARIACEACGTTVNQGVKICPACKFPIDHEWYEKNKTRFVK